MTVIVSRYTRAQGGGWAVDVYDEHGQRRTDSRWTNRRRAILEGAQLSETLGASLYIY